MSSTPSLLTLRRTAQGLLAASLAALVATSSVALADPITFNIINPSGNQSRIDLSATGMLLGGALTIEPQSTAGQGSLSTLYAGTIETDLTQVGLGLPGGSNAAAQNATGLFSLPLQLAPNVNGASGTTTGNYGIELNAPIEGIPLPEFEYEGVPINLGTITGVTSNIALRDVVLDVTSTGSIPLLPGSTLPQSFDASQVGLSISGNADVTLQAVLQQDNLLTYFANLVVIQTLAGSVDGLTVTGNLGAQTISIGYGTRLEIPATAVDNSGAGAGTLQQVGGNYRLTIPVDFELIPEFDGLGDIFEVEFGLSGQLVAEAPFQPVSVPEPSSVILALTAAAALGLVIRRRRS